MSQSGQKLLNLTGLLIKTEFEAWAIFIFLLSSERWVLLVLLSKNPSLIPVAVFRMLGIIFGYCWKDSVKILLVSLRLFKNVVYYRIYQMVFKIIQSKDSIWLRIEWTRDYIFRKLCLTKQWSHRNLLFTDSSILINKCLSMHPYLLIQ